MRLVFLGAALALLTSAAPSLFFVSDLGTLTIKACKGPGVVACIEMRHGEKPHEVFSWALSKQDARKIADVLRSMSRSER